MISEQRKAQLIEYAATEEAIRSVGERFRLQRLALVFVTLIISGVFSMAGLAWLIQFQAATGLSADLATWGIVVIVILSVALASPLMFWLMPKIDEVAAHVIEQKKNDILAGR